MRDRRWLTLTLLATAQFMVVLDLTIVNVALPHIQTALGFSADGLQWVVSAYTLLFGGFLLLGGRAADLLGRRGVFSAGLGLFTLASLVAGLETSPAMMIAARAAQGLGGALLSPAALSLLTVTFPHGRERNIALGIWGALAGLGEPWAWLPAACWSTRSDGSGCSSSTSRSAWRSGSPLKCSSRRAGSSATAVEASTSRARCWARSGCCRWCTGSSVPRWSAGARSR